jgi:V/A-type H+-transporting ATPase subunit K
MKGTHKFYLLIGIFQLFLILSVIFSVDLISAVAAQTDPSVAIASYDAAKYYAIGAGIAVGLATLGAGIAIKTTGTAAISLLAENEGAFFKAFLVVALGEALAVYGLIVSILLWTKIP